MTVAKLKELLQLVPDDAIVRVVEGVDTGIIILQDDENNAKQLAFFSTVR